jgi:hypothetical protein
VQTTVTIAAHGLMPGDASAPRDIDPLITGVIGAGVGRLRGRLTGAIRMLTVSLAAVSGNQTDWSSR